MGLLIDSSVLIAAEREGKSLHSLASTVRHETLSLSAITASELLHGAHRAESAQRRHKRDEFVQAIFDHFEVLPFGLEAARTHARLRADLQGAGTPIGAHDLIIAATALTHELGLWTINRREFGRIAGLRLI